MDTQAVVAVLEAVVVAVIEAVVAAVIEVVVAAAGVGAVRLSWTRADVM